MARPIIDLTGKVFGHLTVVKRADHDYIRPNGCATPIWVCDCDCGKTAEVRRDCLTSGSITSCGHTKFEHKENEYDLSGSYGIGYTTNGEKFYFDLEDYEKIKQFCWHISNNGYVLSSMNGKRIQMHRWLLKCPTGKFVDHINHNRNDNRKSNLRIVTTQENTFNNNGRNSKSGYRGVSFHKKNKNWRAKISVNGKEISKSGFPTAEEAFKYRLKLEEKYFGEYSYYNSVEVANV